MQTTLLGVAIAFIIALAAALVGPVFIDWNEFRPRFEAEATRALGVQVRVAGPLDARLLPVPSLRLKSVSIGSPNDPGRLRAEGFDVDLSLGALLRGEFLATELSISGVSVDLGLDAKGQIDWPAGGQLNLRRFAIERLNVTGRIALHDAASRSTVELNDIAFSGDVRPQASALRGDGNFQLSGTRYPFRISTSANEQGGTRLKLALDAAEISAAGEVDGVLMLDGRQPRFDGTLQLARIAGAKADKGDTRPPWKMTAKLKADPARTVFEQIEWGRGVGDAQKLAGSGEMRFGADPMLRASLTSKSLDAAQWVGAENSGKPVATALPRLVDALGDLPPLPFAADISLGAEQIILGGKPIQNAVLNVATSGDRWRLTRLDFRGPGATRVTLDGAFAAAAGSQFEGRLDLASNDPDSFVTWLQGRNFGGAQFQKPLRVAGNLKFGPLAIVLDDIKADIDGGALKGRIAWAQPDAGPSKFGVALQGDRVDLDTAFAMVRASLGPQGSWPASGDVALDFASAVAGGQAMSPFGVSFGYDADRMTLERLRIGEASGITIDGSGAFDRKTASGTLALSSATPSLARLAALLAPSSPAISSRLSALTVKDGPARLSLTLGFDSDQAKPDRARARASLGIEAASLAGTISLTASPSAQAIRALDLESLQRGELGLETKLLAPRGDALTKLLGIGHLADAGNEPLSLESSLTGAWNAPLRGIVKLSGKALDADLQGSAELWADSWAAPRAASLRLAVRKANIAPMLGLANGAAQAISSFASRLTIAGNDYSFEGIDGTFGGARLRGRVNASLAEPRSLDGEIGLDRLDLAPVYAYAIGAAGHDSSEPLRAGPLAGWRTKLSFVALRGVLPGDVELQPLSAVLRGDGSGLALESIKARLGGGEIAGTGELRPGPAGVTFALQAQTSDMDAAALRYRGLKLPPGKATVKLSLQSQGRSAAALASALSGEGVLTLSNARIAGLDNKAFDAAVTAFDLSQIANEASLRKVVEQALANGELSIASAQIPFAINDGRLRVNATPLETPDARAIVSGGYDFAADQADIRAVLTAPNLLGAGKTPPEVQIFAVGPPDRMARTVDVSPLSSWLAIRAIDRETRRLDALEREAPTAALTRPADSPPQAADPLVAMPKVRIEPRIVPRSPMLAPEANAQEPQPLPPAIQVGPPPGMPRLMRPQPSPPRPLSLLPPASGQRPGF